MAALLVAGVFLTLAGLSQALPSEAELRLLEDLIRSSDAVNAAGADGSGVAKRDLEFNQYVPAYRLRGEPSCEELRAMWRLSKREARRATSTNQLPRSRPYSYGRLIAFAPSPHQRPFVYGEPRNFAHHHSFSPGVVKGSFNRLQAMLGMGAGRPGSFQRVRNMVASQRLPGESPKGKLEELQRMVLGGKKAKIQGEVGEVSPSLRSSEVYQPVRRTPTGSLAGPQQEGTDSNHDEGFIGPLLPSYNAPGAPRSLIPAAEWRLRPWNTRQVCKIFLAHFFF